MPQHIGVCCLPVTQEIVGSSPIGTANKMVQLAVKRRTEFVSCVWGGTRAYRNNGTRGDTYAGSSPA